MTVRAVIIGLLAAAAICAFGFFNDMVMQQTFLVGNYMPISVFGGLLIFLLVVNPLLARAGKSVALSGRELAVIVAIVLPACYVPGRGFTHYFTTALMIPRHIERTDASWSEHKIIEMAPQVMLAGVGPRFVRQDILDPGGLCVRLVREGEAAARLSMVSSPRGGDNAVVPTSPQAAEPGSPKSAGPAGRIWALLTERDRAAISEAAREAAREAATVHDDACRGALLGALNRLLPRRDLYDREAFAGVTLPKAGKDLLERHAAWRGQRRGPDFAASLEDPTAAALRHLAQGGAQSPSRGAGLSVSDVRTLNRRLLDAACPRELRSLDASADYAITGFVQGLGQGAKHIGLSEVPWYAWTGTLFGFWLPLVVAMSVAVIGLSLVVHRQWSEHEHLPYPIVAFASSLLPGEGESRGGVFSERLFWIGSGVIFAIHLNNCACQWWPESMVQIPRYFDLRSLTPLLPGLKRGGDWAIMNPTIYFTAVAFAYFVATDVSLSLGIAPFVYAMIAGTFAGYGIAFSGAGRLSLQIEGFIYGGAFFGMFLVLAYTGRRYFWQVFRRSMGLRAADEVDPGATWGARAFMAGTLIFVLQLVTVGLEWQWAVFYTAVAVMLFLVMSRVVAETGVFFFKPHVFPAVILMGFLGQKAVGPGAMLVMFMVSCVLLLDAREAVMPFMVHGLKLVDEVGKGRKVRLGRTAAWGAAALVLGLAVAVPTVLYIQYDRGAIATGDAWTTRHVPRYAFDAALIVKQKLSAQGVLSEAGELPGKEKLGAVWTPYGPGVLAFFVSLGLVLFFAAARLRFPWWPLHPVMFLMLACWMSRTLAVSFLLGWFIKMTVTKYGGAAVYRKLKPLMIGVIAGDIFGGLVPMIVAAIYYFCTGELLRSYRVLPT